MFDKREDVPICPYCHECFDYEEIWYGNGSVIDHLVEDEYIVECPNICCKKEFKVSLTHVYRYTSEPLEEEDGN